MVSIKDIKSRYIEILLKCKVSKRDFCKSMGINEKNYNRFISNDFIHIKHAERIEKLGINIRWLFLNLGTMYNDSKNGYKIKYLTEKLMYEEENYHFKRLTYWIKTHYDSIDNFEKRFNISDKNYFNNISLINKIPMNLLKILSAEGLNVHWLYKYNVSPYLKNDEGRKKKKWLIRNKNSDNLIYLECKGII